MILYQTTKQPNIHLINSLCRQTENFKISLKRFFITLNLLTSLFIKFLKTLIFLEKVFIMLMLRRAVISKINQILLMLPLHQLIVQISRNAFQQKEKQLRNLNFSLLPFSAMHPPVF